MIRTIYNIEKQKAENIEKCSQIDNIQRTGVMTMEQEKQIIKRASLYSRNAMEKQAKVADNEIAEIKREREVFDILDEKRRIDKYIKENNEKFKTLNEESKQIYDRIIKEQEKETKNETLKTETKTE